MSPHRSSPSNHTFDDAWLASLRWSPLDTLEGITRWQARSADGRGHWLVLRAESNEHGAIQCLDREYALGPCLEPAWALLPLARLNTDAGPALVLQDGGRPLSAQATGTLGVEAFLTLAISASAALAKAHERGLCHGDIRPAQLMRAVDGTVRLTGFAGQAPMATGTPTAWSSGRYAYLAPEAHGAPNAALDFDARVRIDLYALGTTFHELLAGQPPFHAQDPLQWRHQHLAVAPPALTELRAELGRPLDRFLAGLLSKQPEQRPASAQAVEAQLWRFLHQWRENGSLLEADLPDLAVPHSGLIAREAPMAALQQAVDGLRQGQGGVVLILGEAGIGKTSLVTALRPGLARQPVLYASSKGELSGHPVPYGSLSAALRQLLSDLVNRGGPDIEAMAERLRRELGEQGAALARLLPELEWVTGPLPTCAQPPVGEAKAYFMSLFQRVLRAIASPARPLLLFLDDLQWADPDTLALLGELDPGSLRHVLLIATCRSDAEATDPTVARVLSRLRAQGHGCRTLQLGPLSLTQIQALLSARLAMPAADQAILAQRLHAGGGNLLYVTQAIELARRRIPDEPWPLFEDFHSLLRARLNNLPAATRELLGALSLLGNATSLEELAAVTSATPEQLKRLLSPALAAGWLGETSAGLAFAHDTMLEAVVATLPKEKQRVMHGRFAERLAARLPARPSAQGVGRVAEQVLRADEAALDAEQRRCFITLLIDAAEQAKAGAAAKVALRYLDHAERLLGSRGASGNLATQVALARAQCLILDADHAAAQAHILGLLEQPLGPLERATLFRLSSEIHALQGDYAGAVRVIARGLSTFGLSVALAPGAAQADAAWKALQREMAGRAPGSLLSLRPCGDASIQAMAELLASLLIPGSFLDPDLMLLTACHIVRLTLAHGLCPASVQGMAWLGVTCAHRFDQYTLGLAWAECANALAEQPPYAAGKVSALVALDQVSVWTQPLPYALERAEQAYALSLAQCSPSLACFSNNHIVSDLLVLGAPIERMLRQIDRGLLVASQLDYSDAQSILHTQALYIRRLAGHTGGTVPIPHRDLLARRVERSQMGPLRFWWLLFEGLIQFLEGAFEKAAAHMDAAWKLTWAVPAHIHLIDLALFTVLNRAALESASGHSQDFEQPMARLRLWAGLNPRYFSDRLALAEGEICRLRGDSLGALRHYEAAIERAAQCGAIHIQGLGHELAGRCHQANGLQLSARQHWRLARDAWRRWGALLLAEQLEAEHPFLLEPDREQHGLASVASRQALDAMSIARACQALSREIEVDALVRSVLGTAVMHAGAARAALLLSIDKDLILRATAHATTEGVQVILCQDAPAATALPLSLLQRAVRSRQSLALNGAEQLHGHAEDPYLNQLESGSVACVPLLKQNRAIGVLYVENTLLAGVFDPSSVQMLEWLTAQAAISLSTAHLYANLMEENQRRRASEAMLKKTRALLAIGQEISRYATFSWRPRDQAGFWSEALLYELGLDHGAELDWARAPQVLVHPDDQARFLAALASARDQAVPLRLEFRGLPKDGRWHCLEVVAEPDGQEGFLGVVSDISERRNTETALRLARSELDRTAQSTILGELAASIAHEINQPLLSILSNAGASLRWLERPEPELGEAAEGLRDIKTEAQRAADIVTAIRTLARQAPLERRPLALDPLIERVLALTQADRDDRQVRLQVNLAAPRQVRGDSVQLQQVVLNLVNNAMDAMQAMPAAERRLNLSSQAIPDGVLVMVEDTGPGIADEHAAQVFQAFYSTKVTGMGMGLAICSSIISAHGGALHSHRGRHGEQLFLFTLPAA